MSSFLNNVDLVHPSEVIFGGTIEEVHESIIPVVLAILQDDTWTNVSSDKINCSVLTGGITNILYLVQNTVTDHKVIVRVFGKGTEVFIDRSIENKLFAKLSTLKVGPTFHGLFQNGRVEGHINGRPLEPDEFSIPLIYHKIAKSVAILHAQHVPEIGQEDNWLWTKAELFFQLTNDLKFDDTKAALFVNLNVSNRLEDLHKLQSYLKLLEEATKNLSTVDSNSAGKLFAFTKPLTHNDLLAGNILLTNSPSTTGEENDSYCTIIDYEYGAYNYRGFDIANHFNEGCGFDMNLNKFPTSTHRKDFIHAYLAALDIVSNVDEDFISGFEEIILIFTLSSHLFWGSWAVVQAGISTVDFDYLGYAKLRFDAHDYMKKLLNLDY